VLQLSSPPSVRVEPFDCRRGQALGTGQGWDTPGSLAAAGLSTALETNGGGGIITLHPHITVILNLFQDLDTLDLIYHVWPHGVLK